MKNLRFMCGVLFIIIACFGSVVSFLSGLLMILAPMVSLYILIESDYSTDGWALLLVKLMIYCVCLAVMKVGSDIMFAAFETGKMLFLAIKSRWKSHV